MIMCVLLCYPVSIRIYYQQGGLFLVSYCMGLKYFLDFVNTSYQNILILSQYVQIIEVLTSLIFLSSFVEKEM